MVPFPLTRTVVVIRQLTTRVKSLFSVATGFFGTLALVLSTLPVRAQAPLEISEFMADNRGVLADDTGAFSDWIEIRNRSNEPVDLAGYRLTDDPQRNRSWTFPAVTLPARGYLLVFASGRDRRDPAAPLHTDFRLDADGEYLALLGPDGRTVIDAFAPAFPPQRPDLSYGRPEPEAVRDLLTGATARMRVPTAERPLEAGWEEPGFVPTTDWRSLTGLPLGHDANAGDEAGNLASGGTASQSSVGFGSGAALAIDGDLNTYTHTLSDDNASTWSVRLARETEITRIVLHNRADCCQSRLRDLTVSILAPDGSTVRWRSSLLNPENTLDGPAAITLDLFDLEIGPVAGQVVRVERTPDPDLSGSGGQGNADEDNVLSLGEVEVFGVDSISYLPLLRTDLGPEMRGKSASVAARLSFVIDPPPPGEPLRLRVRYDDGFVAWLNGRRVAEANAPAVTSGLDRATAEHPDPAALEYVDFTIPAGDLVAGTNLFAVLGLNLDAADDDFLLDARLEATGAVDLPPAFFATPTPRAANRSTWFVGILGPPRFSVGRGFPSAPFPLSLTSDDAGASIVYTLDGSEPTEGRGTLYQGPFTVDRTSVVRARCLRPFHRASPVTTHTYLFLSDVVRQPANPPGLPNRWANIAADYEMDPAITRSPAYAGSMIDALRALPSVSFTTDNDHLFGATRGIYANPENRGEAWERPVSMEWLDPEGADEFQIDAGLRIQGGWFRQRGATRKHSLRVLFKDLYGPGRLRHDLFGEFGAAREFDTLVFRAGANDGYTWDAARDTEQFLRDEFGRRLALAMGQPAPRGRFVHLYLNGLYWGLYNLCERPNEDFSSTYFGGAPEDWDAVNSGEIKSGDLQAWNRLVDGVRTASTTADLLRLRGLGPGGERDPALPVLLDLANYTDYMLLNIWGGNWDWPNKNFWFGRDRRPEGTGFKFYLWDFENTMGNNRDRSPLDMVSPRAGLEASWVGEPHHRLRNHPDYRVAFADRVQRHLLGQGPLGPTALVERYRRMAAELEIPVIAETARWGDDHHEPPQDLEDWRRERDWLLGSYLPRRTAVVLGQFRRAGLFPSVDAPAFAPNGGSLSPAAPVVVRTPARWVYYTLDGSDPRLPGGAPHPAAQRVEFESAANPNAADPTLVPASAVWSYWDRGTDPGSTWNQPGFDDASWPSGPAQLGYGDGDEATVVGFVDANPSQAGVQRNAATYFRSTFLVTDPAAFRSLVLEVTYDDAVAVYLNGRELHRSDNLPADATFVTYATADRADNTVDSRTDLPSSLLVAGTNTVAVQVHQRSATSSDLSFALVLSGVPRDEPDPLADWNESPPIRLAGPGWIRARSWTGSEWSALAEARFTFDTKPPQPGDLVLSEIAYLPPDAAGPAEIAVSDNRDDYEFVELQNVGTTALDLSGVRLAGGIEFVFPAGSVLAAGERTILASRAAAFAARYGPTLPLAGEFSGRLGNEGDVVRLENATGQPLEQLAYASGPPWPAGPADRGFTLVRIRPEARLPAADPASWRTSVRPAGSPGATDRLAFAGSPAADLDGNGRADLIDHALGESTPDGELPTLAIAWERSDGADGPPTRLILSHPRRRAADDAIIGIEWAEALAGPWLPAGPQLEFLGSEDHGDGFATWFYRATLTSIAQPRRYFRLRVELAPASLP